ncbi:hypothetical protein DPMN_095682 [Dreissena polymorpha]|uniref:Uncharacterized protein n=1 Tax=Dreissena polymorpha TaxID=45954 RepID=A0A9D4L6Y8_DREPO|nr:hypothetical protein DPMN_095682 [Dreissena polymorpha]
MSCIRETPHATFILDKVWRSGPCPTLTSMATNEETLVTVAAAADPRNQPEVVHVFA